jgi:MobA/VirD2-like, nuclease domain
MILKGNQRAGASQMGFHLLRTDDNDHVEVHEIRGFVARNVVDALREAYAISRGTKCAQFMFSLSLNPPPHEHVPVAAFEDAINEAEVKLGLVGQPRVVVFHEKDGRRHAHCVWSRIRASSMTAINLAHTRLKLRELARKLFIEHGWKMPRGLVKSEESNPLNFSREEWQQAKRINRDPKVIKQIFQDCWAISDSRGAFRQAMEARGYYLAQGDRRGHVAVDWTGEIYAVARWTGVRAKEVSARLGDPVDLPTVESVKKDIADRVSLKLNGFAAAAKRDLDAALQNLSDKRGALVLRQRTERAALNEQHVRRRTIGARARAERFRTGLRGVWDRITGKHAALKKQNETDLDAARKRDAAERQALIERQLAERQELQSQIKVHHARHEKELSDLLDETIHPNHRDIIDSHQRSRKRNRNIRI